MVNRKIALGAAIAVTALIIGVIYALEEMNTAMREHLRQV